MGDLNAKYNLTPVADTSLKGLKSILSGAKDGLGIGEDAAQIGKELEKLLGLGGNSTKRSYKDLKERHVALSHVLARQDAVTADVSLKNIVTIGKDALDVLEGLLYDNSGNSDSNLLGASSSNVKRSVILKRQNATGSEPTADIPPKTILNLGKDALDILSGLLSPSSTDDMSDNGTPGN